VQTTSVLLAATPRTGSTLLCRALEDTGVCGRPTEHFIDGDASSFPEGWTFWEEGLLAVEHGVTTRPDFVDLVRRLGTTPNGVFATKVMWPYLGHMIERFRGLPEYHGLNDATLLHRAFPGLRVVKVDRRDRVRQAVSWLRVVQTGIWVVSDTEPAPPDSAVSYDRGWIDGLIDAIEQADTGWRGLFADLDLEPITVVYEDLVGDGYDDAIQAVLRHAGVDATDLTIPTPRTNRQADAITEEWVARYNAGE
jgi:LPS sulfotransferase NodH